ncbi:S1 family peptidase [Streptomyces gamaensis]|uniref:S1 family peptidase n=1 Tax=Streptomyces gamaensis TaxID=1763542 RepID=A0ABW0ZAM2_9ACTN
MKPRRIRLRASLAAAALALATVTLHPQSAGAAPAAPRALSAASAGRLATVLAGALEEASAGSYYDTDTRRLVVDITDPAASARVRAAGAEPRLVKHSKDELEAARAELDSRAAIPGTTWVADPRLNKVVVSADPTVTGTKLARLQEAVRRLGDKAVVRRTPTRLTRYLAGGDAIYGSRYRCSVGFNVQGREGNYFLTAGHCGNVEKHWSARQGGPEIGRTEDSRFPGTDYALVKYVSPQVQHESSKVDLYNGSYQNITSAGDAYVGQPVTRSGSTTHVRQGKVTATDATANYPEGTVHHLVETDACAEGGDSGGPFFDGTVALGTLSGGTGNCGPLSLSESKTYFQPVRAALAAYGVSIG